MEGRVYGSIEEKVEAVNAYLRELESDPPKSAVAWQMGLDRGSGPGPTVQLCGLLRLKWYETVIPIHFDYAANWSDYSSYSCY